MDVWSVLAAAVRRWYVALPVAALVLVPVLLVDTSGLAEFEVEGDVLIEEPGVVSDDVPESERSNIYASSSGPSILAIEVDSPEVRQSLSEQGLSPSFDLSPSSQVPVLGLTSRGPTAEVTIRSAEALIEEIRKVLAAGQTVSGIPEPRQVSLRVIRPPTVAEQTSSGTVVLIVGGAVALIAGLSAAVVFDSLRRRRHKTAPGDSQVEDFGQSSSDDVAPMPSTVPRS